MAVDLATDGLRVRIQQELRWVAPMTFGGLVRAVDPVAVSLTRLDPWDVGVPDIAVDLDELDPRLLAVLVDEAELDARRNLGEEREVHSGAVKGRTQRVWPSRPRLDVRSSAHPSLIPARHFLLIGKPSIPEESTLRASPSSMPGRSAQARTFSSE